MTNIVDSSLAYEIALYLNTFYLGMFIICEVAIGVLKAINVPYPENVLATEAGIFGAFCLIEMLRVFLGRRGDLSGTKIPIYFSIILTVPASAGVCFLLFYQTYILRLEYILCIVMLLLHGLETGLAVISIATMCRKQGFE